LTLLPQFFYGRKDLGMRRPIKRLGQRKRDKRAARKIDAEMAVEESFAPDRTVTADPQYYRRPIVILESPTVMNVGWRNSRAENSHRTPDEEYRISPAVPALHAAT
jgi:hypothetical protein